MMFCLSFCFVGCDKNAEDMEEGAESGESSGGSYGDPSGMVAPLYGTKLLYRPTDYDYNAGSGGTETAQNNYYGQYAWNVINSLYNTYGIVNDDYAKGYLGFDPSNPIADTLYLQIKPYLYDSIRYQVDTQGTVIAQKKEKADAPGEYEEIDITDYQLVGADYSKAWNWSFSYDYALSGAIKNPISQTLKYSQGTHIYSNNFTAASNMIYSQDAFASAYKSIYVTRSTEPTAELQQRDEANYSSYVKALEYALYNLALDVNPQRISINHSQPNAATGEPFTVYVGNPAKPLDEALAMARETFEANGTYVGLSQRQIDKLGDWIMTNVIGTNVDTTFTTYNEIYEVVDKDGNFVKYEFGSPTTTVFDREYEKVVENILQNNFDKVKIGNTQGEGDVNINQAFLSSEVVEYCGEGFFVDGDEWFVTDEFMTSNPNANKLPYIPAREYQSAMFMPFEDWELRGIYVALKYDADGDGTDEQWGEEKSGYPGGRWNADLYIDIVVELNYYSVEDQKVYSLGSKKCRVYDGPFDPYFSNSFVTEDQYDEWGNVHFGDFDKVLGEGSKHLSGKNLVIGSYNHEPLKSISTFESVDDYLKNYRSIAPIKLVGTSSQRNFYKLIEPTDEELTGYGENLTYSTGQLDPNAVGNACDYLEVTYKVLKDKNDLNKNYKFHTAISGVW